MFVKTSLMQLTIKYKNGKLISYIVLGLRVYNIIPEYLKSMCTMYHTPEYMLRMHKLVIGLQQR